MTGSVDPRVEEVVRRLERLERLLGAAGEPRWASSLARRRAVLAAAVTEAERHEAARAVLTGYRGAGSFSDLVLQTAEGVRAEQPELDRLRAELFEAARDLLAPLREVPVARLRTLVDAAAADDVPQAARAGRLLASLGDQETCPVSRSEVAALRVSYRRRAVREGSDPALAALARTFEALEADHVTSAAVAAGGEVAYLWFDEGMTTVVGCWVGPDRRTP